MSRLPNIDNIAKEKKISTKELFKKCIQIENVKPIFYYDGEDFVHYQLTNDDIKAVINKNKAIKIKNDIFEAILPRGVEDIYIDGLNKDQIKQIANEIKNIELETKETPWTKIHEVIIEQAIILIEKNMNNPKIFRRLNSNKLLNADKIAEELNDHKLGIPELRNITRGTSPKQMAIVIRKAIKLGKIKEPYL